MNTLFNLKGATWGGLGLGLSVGTTNAAFGRAGSICGEGGGFGRAGSVMGGAVYGTQGPSLQSLSELADIHAKATLGDYIYLYMYKALGCPRQAHAAAAFFCRIIIMIIMIWERMIL